MASVEQEIHEQQGSAAKALLDLRRARDEMERRLDALTASAGATASQQRATVARTLAEARDATVPSSSAT